MVKLGMVDPIPYLTLLNLLWRASEFYCVNMWDCKKIGDTIQVGRKLKNTLLKHICDQTNVVGPLILYV